MGSAQIGLNYGISNKTGKIANSELEDIFQLMKLNKINLIDTAKNYGDAEEIIGNYREFTSDFDIITKLDISEFLDVSENDFEKLNSIFEDSLKKLRRNKIEGILIHNPYLLSKTTLKLFLAGLKI